MRKLLAIGIIGIFLCFTGCGQKENTSLSETQQSTTDIANLNWQEAGFALETISATQELQGEEAEIYHEAFYKELERPVFDFVYTESRVAVDYGTDCVYAFYTCETSEGVRYVWKNTVLTEEEVEPLDVTLPKELTGGYAIAMDSANGEKLSVLFVETKADYTSAKGLYLLEMDGQGSVVKFLMLSDEFIKDGQVSCALFLVDEQGYSYIVNGQRTKLYIYDTEGNCVLQSEYTDEAGDVVRGGFHTPDGCVILLIGNYNEASTKLVWYNGDLKPVVVQTLDAGAIPLAHMTDTGTIYYMSTSRIYAWNVVTGKRNKVFDCMLHNIDYSNIDCMMVTDEEEIVLYSTKGGETEGYVLSKETVVVEEDDLNLFFLASSDPYLKTTVATFSRNNKDMAITIETASGDKDTYHDRIMAELVAGNGPDLLWVNAEDMQILYEKGVIMPIRELVKEETLAQVFPGVIESGTVDGELVGVYFDAMPLAFAVNKELLGKEEWTVKDLLRISSENPQLGGFMASQYHFEAAIMLNSLALTDLEHSGFVDFENGTSHFDNAEFVNLLKAFKQYGKDKSDDDALERVCNKEYLAFRTVMEVKDLPAYSELMAQCSAECQLMGFPGSGQYQGCWMQNNFLVVNTKTADKEAIAKFLEYAFSLQAQRECTKGSIRKDIIRNQVYIHEYYGTYVYGSGAQELILKENGETYLEDYLSFLENCAPLPHSYEAIENIVSEEVEMFFNGNYTAQQVAENIDSRVQLYLDEQG